MAGARREAASGTRARGTPVTRPAVSVVIPAYNAERTLEASIRSVLAQTMRDLELVVVDDGSADQTVALAGSISDPRVSVLSQDNAGAAAARNTGIRAATGRYVAFLDADDLWVADKLERQLTAFERDPEAIAVQAGAYFVDPALRILSVERCRPASDTLLQFLQFGGLPAVMETLVVRREIFDEIGMFDESLAILEDWELAIRLARHGRVVGLPEPLALYRLHPGNRSHDLQLHVEPGLRVLARLFADASLPVHVRARKRRIYARFYLMLMGGALRERDPRQVAHWGARAVATDPRALGYLAAMPARRMRRARDARAFAGHE